MAIQWIGKNIECLSTDTKPTLVPINTRAFENNTGDVFLYNGTAWVSIIGDDKTGILTNKTIDAVVGNNILPHSGGPNYVVIYDPSISGSNKYRLRNSKTGVIEAQGLTLDAVVPTALAAFNAGIVWSGNDVKGGWLYIPSGRHVLSASFAGFDMCPYSRVTMAPNCVLYIPDGYAGFVWRLNGQEDTYFLNSILEGGYIREYGGNGPTALHLWTAVRLQANAAGTASLSFNMIRDMSIIYAKNGIEFFNNDPTGTAWINSLTVSNCSFQDCVYNITFNQNGAPLNAGLGTANRNIFISCRSQSGDNSLIGIKDIHGVNNMFIDCTQWDYHKFGDIANKRSSNIALGAKKTYIFGGAMTNYRFLDESAGQDTIIFDEFLCQIPQNITLNSILGTKIGTGTTQKLGFYNKTPIVQPAAITSPTADVTSLKTSVDAIRTSLTNLGLTA